MSQARRPDPLHGVALEAMLEHIVGRYGWPGLGARIDLRCFTHDPSVRSSRMFLRKTPWARAKVESLYRHSVAHPRKGAAPPGRSGDSGRPTPVSRVETAHPTGRR